MNTLRGVFLRIGLQTERGGDLKEFLRPYFGRCVGLFLDQIVASLSNVRRGARRICMLR